MKRLTGTRAYQATETTSLVALSNTPKNGITPSNLLPGKNSIAPSGSTWRFVYQDKDGHMAYSYEPKTGTLDDFTVQVDDGGSFQPALGGGAIATVKEGEKTEGIPLRGGKAVNVSRDGDSLIVLWEYNLKDQLLRLAWAFKIVGKALVLSVRCDEPLVGRFSLGDVGLGPMPVSLIHK